MAGPWEKFAPAPAETGPWAKFDRRQADGMADSVMNDDAYARRKGGEMALEGMSTLDQIRAGAGKAVADLGRGVAQYTPFMGSGDIRESRERDSALMNTPGGFGGNLGANVAMAAPLTPSTVPQALAVGPLMGLLQPAENGGERAMNVGVQTVGALAVPALRAANAATEPFYEGGRNRIMGRALQRAAGDDAGPVAERLSLARELVPGSLPTTGQAAGNAGIAAMERAAFASEPSVTVPLAERMASQNTARVEALRDLSGTSGARTAAEGARSAAANTLYDRAYTLGLDPAGTGIDRGIQKELAAILKTPAGQKAVTEARRLAANEGVNLKDAAAQVKGLDYIKRALDDQIGASAGNDQRILTALKSRFLGAVDKLSPEYGAARQTFADMSRPINQMDVAQTIADKSIRPLDDTMTAAAYARALSDDTARSVTGMDRATLSSVMEPQQMGAMNAIKDDLARAEFAKNAGRGAGSDTVQKLAYNNLMQQSGLTSLPNLLSRPVQLLEYGSRAAYSSADREMRQKLAEAMLDPKRAAELMNKATPSTAGRRMASALRYSAGAPAMGFPMTLNASKQ